MTPDKTIIKGYSAVRYGTYKKIICHAPFVNLNFEQNGNVRACCYNSEHILGQWPKQTIKQIWHSASADQLRDYIKQNDLGSGCITCGKMLEAGNYQGVRAQHSDPYAPNTLTTRFNYFKQALTGAMPYPKVMEFELSNTCNLECVMCTGYFSSSIRKNRENLPPITSPYNEKFVDELEEFIPHLTDAKFLGGEPFMIDIYLAIWERIRKINPKVRIHITTNGTFLNNRIKDLLEGLQAGIIVSIDSLDKETYPKIRVNGSFEKVMENLSYFREYTLRKKTFLAIAACPIIYNWKELPEMVQFCMKNNIRLNFNTVISPSNLSLRDQSSVYLQQVVSFLTTHPAPSIHDHPRTSNNHNDYLTIQAYNDYISLLQEWQKEAKMKEDHAYTLALKNENTEIENYLNHSKNVEWSLDNVRQSIYRFSEINALGFNDNHRQFMLGVAGLFASTPVGHVQQLLQCYTELYDAQNNTNALTAATEKINFISSAIEQHPQRKEILTQISQLTISTFTKSLLERDIEELQNDLQKFV